MLDRLAIYGMCAGLLYKLHNTIAVRRAPPERGGYLQGHLGVKFELGHTLRPGNELLGLWVDTVIEDGADTGKLDSFELATPPLAELHPGRK